MAFEPLSTFSNFLGLRELKFLIFFFLDALVKKTYSILYYFPYGAFKVKCLDSCASVCPFLIRQLSSNIMCLQTFRGGGRASLFVNSLSCKGIREYFQTSSTEPLHLVAFMVGDDGIRGLLDRIYNANGGLSAEKQGLFTKTHTPSNHELQRSRKHEKIFCFNRINTDVT